MEDGESEEAAAEIHIEAGDISPGVESTLAILDTDTGELFLHNADRARTHGSLVWRARLRYDASSSNVEIVDGLVVCSLREPAPWVSIFGNEK